MQRTTTPPGPKPALPSGWSTLLLLFLLPGLVSAQTPADSSAATQDSLRQPLSFPPPGLLERTTDSSSALTREQLSWRDARYLGGHVELTPGAFLRNQNSEGMYNQVTMAGADWRTVAVMVNGRVMSDPASGIFNLYNARTQSIDRLEIITGTRAFLYGLNSTGASVNLTQRTFDTNRPFTNITYFQSGYGYQHTDGTFSQNIVRGLNATLGLRFLGSEGRYANSLSETWNVDFALRSTPLDNLQVILSERYTNTRTDLNGGIDPDQTPPDGAFSPIQAVVKNLDSYEKTNRHDIDLTMVGTFLADSANVTSFSVYYSWNLREYRDEENRSLPNGIFLQSDHRSSWMGLQATQNLHSAWQRFTAGGMVEIRQIEGSPNLGQHRNVIGACWAKEEILVGDAVTIAGYGRYDRYLNADYAGLGADVRVRPLPFLLLSGGISSSARVPNATELYWTGQDGTRSEPLREERHRLLAIGADITLPLMGSIRTSAFYRKISHPILLDPAPSTSVFPAYVIRNGETITAYGAEAGVSLRVWVLQLEATAAYLRQEDSAGTRLSAYPTWWGTAGIYFRNSLLDGALDLLAGFRGRAVSSSRGNVFNPESLVYVPNEGRSINGGASVDLVVTAQIGAAKVHFVWENLTDAQYYTTPYYPVLDRTLRFGISWDFLD